MEKEVDGTTMTQTKNKYEVDSRGFLVRPEEWDEEALEIYRQAMPGYEVVGVYFGDHPVGSVHCTSKEIPATLTDTLAK